MNDGRRALRDAIPITLFIVGAFYYWFALANRYVIFLYGHVAHGIAKTEPFDAMTSSRYWMAGLVATGAVLLLYTGLCWLLGLLGRRRGHVLSPPSWRQVWLFCALPLAVGIPLLTMTVNRPTLPPMLAAACVVSTLVGLALALWLAAWAAQRPLDLLWLGVDGAGLMPILLLLRVIELPGRGVAVPGWVALFVAVGSVVGAVGWLWVMTRLRAWRGKTSPGAGVLFASGMGSSYLLLPLLHYLLGKPDYRYITAASNFFAFNWVLQLLILILAGSLALGVTAIRRRVRRHSTVETAG